MERMTTAARSAGDVVAAYPLFQEGSGGAIPTSALQLNFIVISTRLACHLNAKWHSVLPRIQFSSVKRSRYCICYGAEYDGNLYAAALWSHPIAANRMRDGDRLIELRRMAINAVAPKNTASRMLAFMCRDIHRRWPELIRAVSYQATDTHAGTIYKASGWTPVNTGKFTEWAARPGKPVHGTQNASAKVRWEKQLS